MTPPPFIPSYLPETPSQTAGPYVHIGLIPEQAGFEIFENNFSGDIAGPVVAGQRILIEGRYSGDRFLLRAIPAFHRYRLDLVGRRQRRARRPYLLQERHQVTERADPFAKTPLRNCGSPYSGHPSTST